MNLDMSERLILHDIATLSIPGREEDLLREVIEKSTRLLGVLRLALINTEEKRLKIMGFWGFENETEVWEQIDKQAGNSFSYPLAQGLLYMEQAEPLTEREKRLYAVFARRVEDIFELRQAERELVKQKKYVEVLFKNSSDAIVFFNREHRVLDINQSFSELFGYTIDEIRDQDLDQVLANSEKYQEVRCLTQRVFHGQQVEVETVRYSKAGKHIDVSIKEVPVLIDGKLSGGYAIFTDITERKVHEQQLKYLSLHDVLTELYNRAFFEEELCRMTGGREYPITIISADLDGLKLINETMGHRQGDELLKACARVLKANFRGSDILARVGGDEFTALLPHTRETEGERIISRIRSALETHNWEHPELPLSLSLGRATAVNAEESLDEVLKKADNLMFRDKLYRSVSVRSQIVRVLLAALSERDYLTGGHAHRLQEVCRILGENIGLTSRQMTDLVLLAQVHDLGKVGMPDSILLKNGSLTEAEWEVMRLHSEKGYRIACSSSDLSPIAELILHHHERWDGTGYPLGLKGERIPLECRILAIADIFDAMTNDRPYREARSKLETLAEIERCAGTQFDPKLVKQFLSVLGKDSRERSFRREKAFGTVRQQKDNIHEA